MSESLCHLALTPTPGQAFAIAATWFEKVSAVPWLSVHSSVSAARRVKSLRNASFPFAHHFCFSAHSRYRRAACHQSPFAQPITNPPRGLPSALPATPLFSASVAKKKSFPGRYRISLNRQCGSCAATYSIASPLKNAIIGGLQLGTYERCGRSFAESYFLTSLAPMFFHGRSTSASPSATTCRTYGNTVVCSAHRLLAVLDVIDQCVRPPLSFTSTKTSRAFFSPGRSIPRHARTTLPAPQEDDRSHGARFEMRNVSFVPAPPVPVMRSSHRSVSPFCGATNVASPAALFTMRRSPKPSWDGPNSTRIASASRTGLSMPPVAVHAAITAPSSAIFTCFKLEPPSPRRHADQAADYLNVNTVPEGTISMLPMPPM